MVLFLQTHFRVSKFIVYEARTSLFLMVIRKCLLLLLLYIYFFFANKDIILCWVRSYIGISGNGNTDSATKSAYGFASYQGWCTLY